MKGRAVNEKVKIASTPWGEKGEGNFAMESDIDGSSIELGLQSFVQCSCISKQKGYAATIPLFLIISLPFSRSYLSEHLFRNFCFEQAGDREAIVPKTGRNNKLNGQCFIHMVACLIYVVNAHN